MVLKMLCVIVLVGSFVLEAMGQSTKPIPVYPGAKLVTDREEGSEPVCCDFITADAFGKVAAFYEKQLKTKALDTKALAAAYPAMKQQVQMMEQQMPTGMKFRAFVVEEVTVNEQKSPVLFEVMGTPQGVSFSIGDQALAGNDAQFAKQWREKTGKLTQEETAQKESDARQADEDKEQKERETRRTKEMPEYMTKMTAELTNYLRQEKIALSPGLECADIQRFEGESSSGFMFYYTTKDDFQKASGFYGAHGKASPVDNQKGASGGWLKDETVCFWRQSEFLFGESVRVEVREVSQTKEGPKKTYVCVSVSSQDVINKLRPISEEYQSRW